MRQHIQKTRISNWQKLISPFFNLQFYLIQCNSMSIHSIQFQSIQFNVIQFNSMSTLLIHCQPIQFNVKPFNSVSTHSIQCQPIQFNVNPFNSISTNSIQFQLIQFNFNLCNSMPSHSIYFRCPLELVLPLLWNMRKSQTSVLPCMVTVLLTRVSCSKPSTSQSCGTFHVYLCARTMGMVWVQACTVPPLP